MILTARSGRHAVRHQLETMNYQLGEEEFKTFYQSFLRLADKRRGLSGRSGGAADRYFFAEPHMNWPIADSERDGTVPAAVVRLRKR